MLLNTAIAFDVNRVRADFPALHQSINQKPLVYLDNGATAHKPHSVLDATNQFYAQGNANVHRGIHTLSQQATDAYEAARKTIRHFLNAPSEEEIILTSGTTMSCNLVAHSFGEAFLKAGDVVLVSEMEHHANIVPWQLVARRKGATVKAIPVTDSGTIDLDVYRSLLTENVRLVSLIHVSNMLGTINPIHEMIQMAHEQGIPVMVDGAQSAPHLPIDIQALDADFFTFSGHKVFGPTGTGVLFGKKHLLEQMPPFFGGGDMIRTVSFDETSFNVLPHKFEAGTPNIAGFLGLNAALNYVMTLGFEGIEAHEQQLFAYADEQLRAIDGLVLYGPATDKAPVFSFIVQDIHPFDLGTLLDKQGIAVRTGHHCTQPLHHRFGLSGSVRASFTFYNTLEEVDALVQGIQKARRFF
ncbi:MAG: cysteine desulfurase [Bacteroidetes Order II. Incertae sedis bacterium]|nr:cysteine desulfurase [Bacteroidetes Order II. bacterium]